MGEISLLQEFLNEVEKKYAPYSTEYSGYSLDELRKESEKLIEILGYNKSSIKYNVEGPELKSPRSDDNTSLSYDMALASPNPHRSDFTVITGFVPKNLYSDEEHEMSKGKCVYLRGEFNVEFPLPLAPTISSAYGEYCVLFTNINIQIFPAKPRKNKTVYTDSLPPFDLYRYNELDRDAIEEIVSKIGCLNIDDEQNTFGDY